MSRYRDWILQNINADLQTCEESSFQTEEDLNQERRRIQSLKEQVTDLRAQLAIYQDEGYSTCTTPPPTTVPLT
ncbi:hypothetical protein, partial [Salmonella sp. s51884]|uniref:hypothetical protein n=1 Tax=Salmonella sp. s51884 TaxID=3159654 RepID=UPI0039813710